MHVMRFRDRPDSMPLAARGRRSLTWKTQLSVLGGAREASSWNTAALARSRFENLFTSRKPVRLTWKCNECNAQGQNRHRALSKVIRRRSRGSREVYCVDWTSVV